MKHTLSGVAFLLGFAALALAQRGTAPTGYYPGCFAGDIWAGTLTAVDDAKRQMTLTYIDPKHHRAETFVGVIEEGYTVSRRGGPRHELRPSELPLGAQLKVYYCEESRKVEGRKTKVDTVFAIDQVTNLKKGNLVFKAFQ